MDSSSPSSSLDRTRPVVILLRHAEKLDWHHGLAPENEKRAKASYVDNHQLSAKGVERAYALVPYFLQRPEFVRLFQMAPIAAVIAQGVGGIDVGRGRSERPRQTLWPLAAALASRAPVKPTLYPDQQAGSDVRSLVAPSPGGGGGDGPLRLEDGYLKRNVRALIERLRGPEFAGKSVIVAWSHQTLPALAVALGVPASEVPNKWGKRFDVTWVLEPVAGGKFKLVQMPQLLLFGDENSIIEVGKGYKGPSLLDDSGAGDDSDD
ncbi:hypothetical protein DFJ73DRAFT_627845 [Zopfochytrium polystomum]|nr:hypothetical protein DFJ73DRAFT_627845 [Zopfochytrium polystomum]